MKQKLNNIKKIGVIGLGYVGWPLAKSLSDHYRVIGYDIDDDRIQNILPESEGLILTSDPSKLNNLDVYFITVPTPVNKINTPDLQCLLSATEIVASSLQKGAIVIYESTVYPGLTEEMCIPLLEQKSGLKSIKDFKVGYSPERIDPGDAQKTLPKVTKIIAGQDDETLMVLEAIYNKIISCPIHKVSSIKIAESAKILENIQRDVNIALINEFAVFCNKMSINTQEVIAAASTKWNFAYYEPGLVGGHCISVDPYYFIHKAKILGVQSRIISMAREVNSVMPEFIITIITDFLLKNKLPTDRSQITFLGCSFKENCDDIRNSKIIEVIHKITDICTNVSVYDPVVSSEAVYNDYKIKLKDIQDITKSDIIILGVPHTELLNDNELWSALLKKTTVVVDIKGKLEEEFLKSLGHSGELWRL